MFLKPTSRYLLLEPAPNSGDKKEKKEQGNIKLPPSVKKEKKKDKEPFAFYRVIDLASDCVLKFTKNRIILVDNSMVEEVKDFEGNTCFLVLENYVKAAVMEGER